MPSTDSLASYSTTETRNTLPEYIAEVDDNPDVITTSVEIDPDAEDADSETTTTPPAIRPYTEKKVRTRSGLAKLFSRTSLLSSNTPGVRMTTRPRMLKSVSKDPRNGFPIALPVIDGKAVVEVDNTSYRQLMSRVNILLASGAFDDVKLLLDSDDVLRDHVSLVKLADTKKHDYETIDVREVTCDGENLGKTDTLLTVPELDPTREDSDDSQSQFNGDRRGSIASLSSATSSKSSLSQRIRAKLEKKEEWCLIFE